MGPKTSGFGIHSITGPNRFHRPKSGAVRRAVGGRHLALSGTHTLTPPFDALLVGSTTIIQVWYKTGIEYRQEGGATLVGGTNHASLTGYTGACGMSRPSAAQMQC
ncbi:hypothetical protein GOBAR_AA05895 [Gossypium barbadense]|uniref:Uncharacterized protein n=1 Tax=Gossypium barbadense TaxID=3634 RepID=A0A2P5YGI3_GOSBA|nr:hypothetical protein GOBAR_AA05895 [Gossypium barbadense]